jgi:thioesterase domain-containing protein
MSHFYGIISESARKNAPTARGHHSLRVEAQSWQGKIVTRLNSEKDGDYFDVWREPHHSSGGDSLLLKVRQIRFKR